MVTIKNVKNRKATLTAARTHTCPVCKSRKRAAKRRREFLKQMLSWGEIIVIMAGMMVHLWL